MKSRRNSSPPASAPDPELKTELPRLRRKLLKWFAKSQRSYPWRTTNNWFFLLMAEMMLRRTRADQVRPVYEKFIRSYPTPRAAASLSERRLEKLLEPLGLRWRARHLKKTFDYLVDSYEGRKLHEDDDLHAIPGVGDYSAAMLSNRLFNKRIPTIDSNFVRILRRWQGLPFNPEDRRREEIKALAARLVNSKHSRDLNLAMLDFAALVCRSPRPDCASCPLTGECGHYRLAESGS